MKSILSKYENTEVGINLDKPFHLQKAMLTDIADDHFSIMSNNDNSLHHFPYSAVVQLVENPDGIKVGGFWQGKSYYALIIKVGHLVEYIPA